MGTVAVAAPVSRPRARLRTGIIAGVAALAALCVLSLAVGSRWVPTSVVLDALFAHDPSIDNPALHDELVVLDQRLPRTVLAVAVGAALGLAGALMQALTRNPLADAGLLGVNAGAAFAVVFGISVLGLTGVGQYVWLAFLGAGAAAVAVYVIGASGRGRPTPVRLALAGIALSAVLTGVTNLFLLFDLAAYDRFRHWTVGAVAGRSLDVVAPALPFLAAGVVVTLLLGRPLNAIAMGEDLARSLGAGVVRVQAASVVALTLLCGAATAVAGPIGFVGLVVPHLARWWCGPDHRWVLPYSGLLGAGLVVLADVVGRVVLDRGEVRVGIVTAFVGAPALIVLVRRTQVAGL